MNKNLVFLLEFRNATSKVRALPCAEDSSNCFHYEFFPIPGDNRNLKLHIIYVMKKRLVKRDCFLPKGSLESIFDSWFSH